MRTQEEVPEGATYWSKRELARQVGISPTSVHRIWRAFGLQPWRTETFKISPDLLLIDKIRDVVGLYPAPPANAVVFSLDEKPHIQALERTARPGTRRTPPDHPPQPAHPARRMGQARLHHPHRLRDLRAQHPASQYILDNRAGPLTSRPC